MTVQIVGGTHKQIAIEQVTPAAQTSTNSEAVVTGSGIDARPWRWLSYTIKVATNAMKWVIYGANQADYSDEVVVKTVESVAAGASSGWATDQAVYAYYRVKIQSAVADTHGTATVAGLAKG